MHFLADIQSIKEKISENQLDSYLKFIRIMIEIVNKLAQEDYEFKIVKKVLFRANQEAKALEGGKTDFVQMLHNLHVNLVIESLRKRIDFQEVIRKRQSFQQFVYDFKHTKCLSNELKQEI